jgi:hypothetical protein
MVTGMRASVNATCEAQNDGRFLSEHIRKKKWEKDKDSNLTTAKSQNKNKDRRFQTLARSSKESVI